MTQTSQLTLTARNNHITVENQSGQYFQLAGELVRGGFIADPASVKNWNKSGATQPIRQPEKDEIMTQIMKQTINSPFKILFQEPEI
ncbi:hypothetical protein [Paenilisteria rocourtiae]|uniref:Uncharacterized protein n=1 Tax=Listeria rocourtiae TaxID=647910 RepID=A0A4R6ZRL2_9LIST|nr:hypothetical protein [Listeria rocourtiae]EUJ44361.1 hypothetical protein PROCOU_13678 [Listeria rocourtiae FSL F6-920]MBC1603556.1 hypothetical protein [Listeria rocourtiae]TDR55158.1 hypothetical protein DFP96_10187 [Listeria rocourtiae]